MGQGVAWRMGFVTATGTGGLNGRRTTLHLRFASDSVCKALEVNSLSTTSDITFVPPKGRGRQRKGDDEKASAASKPVLLLGRR